ncbi:hypothetical protein Tco_0908418 [Tanacetum coccineum]|uniref:Uncharacterized protein n=1 Tax=Tanacetum coccineum TaxID=301880 RepID=A0ABQ5CP82_9ASTR
MAVNDGAPLRGSSGVMGDIGAIGDGGGVVVGGGDGGVIDGGGVGVVVGGVIDGGGVGVVVGDGDGGVIDGGIGVVVGDGDGGVIDGGIGVVVGGGDVGVMDGGVAVVEGGQGEGGGSGSGKRDGNVANGECLLGCPRGVDWDAIRWDAPSESVTNDMSCLGRCGGKLNGCNHHGYEHDHPQIETCHLVNFAQLSLDVLQSLEEKTHHNLRRISASEEKNQDQDDGVTEYWQMAH